MGLLLLLLFMMLMNSIPQKRPHFLLAIVQSHGNFRLLTRTNGAG
jgi:hypothetical protein